MPSPGEGATLDMPVSGGSKAPHGGRPTEVGIRGDGPPSRTRRTTRTDDDPTAEVGRRPAGATIRPSRPIGVGVPGYEILAEIGRGGMGVVYKARHIRLDRLVALKMILAGAHASDDQIARFHIEARAVAQIQHPGIVQIHEDGDHDGLPYFSLEFVPGGSLAQFINGRPQAPRVAATMVMALCRAMAEAHARGIIHRDLKPANVLLTLDGQPKITDFGLAKQMEGDSQQTRSGAIMGTPSYMAPEQAWGQTREIGPLSDQYALGAILYEMIVGRPPFQGANSARDAGAGPQPGAGPAHEAPAQDADGPGDDLPQGPPEGPRQALPRRRGDGRGPPPLPRRRADRRPPRRAPGARSGGGAGATPASPAWPRRSC